VTELLRAVDVAAVNLETPAAPGAAATKEFVFLAPPQLLPALRRAGVSVVSLANNHALDHGPKAMLDTIGLARAASLTVVGAGPDAAAAYAPAVLVRNGRRVAFVGLSRVVPPGWAATADRPGVASAYDEGAAVAAVRAAADRADVVVVLIHWGTELARCPGDDLRRLAGVFHDAGATVVAGHHPHVLQGVDARADAVTAYSLGNVVWYHARGPSGTTGVLDVTVDPGGAVATTFHPARIGADGRPRLLAGPEGDAVTAAVAGGPTGCWRG
jgi:poly-gamma-glutamate synthesis protein (capsule biosynthesis protein)